MQYNHLIAEDWQALTMPERRKSLRVAYKAGRKAAYQGLIGHGGSELVYHLDLLEACFFTYVIEDFEFRKYMSSDSKKYWHEQDEHYVHEPRVDCFCHGWRQFMIEERAISHPNTDD